jgi:hypothetical protein
MKRSELALLWQSHACNPRQPKEHPLQKESSPWPYNGIHAYQILYRWPLELRRWPAPPLTAARRYCPGALKDGHYPIISRAGTYYGLRAAADVSAAASCTTMAPRSFTVALVRGSSTACPGQAPYESPCSCSKAISKARRRGEVFKGKGKGTRPQTARRSQLASCVWSCRASCCSSMQLPPLALGGGALGAMRCSTTEKSAQSKTHGITTWSCLRIS